MGNIYQLAMPTSYHKPGFTDASSLLTDKSILQLTTILTWATLEQVPPIPLLLLVKEHCTSWINAYYVHTHREANKMQFLKRNMICIYQLHEYISSSHIVPILTLILHATLYNN